MSTRIAVVGGSGFVGRSVISQFAARRVDAVAISAPRLSCAPDSTATVWRDNATTDHLATALSEFDVVINCAGDPDASSRDALGLFGANGALPGVVAAAAQRAGAHRFIHVSSAVVQGRADILDASPHVNGHSVYALSKIAGEEAVAAADSPSCTVIYRPASVHSAERGVTRSIQRLARSPLASVVGPGDDPTPQAHIANVGDAIAEIAQHKVNEPPDVVIHPWEGWTTAELMRTFGDGREPLHIPSAVGPALRYLLRTAARSPRLAPNARRVEMMWFGQRQETSWLTTIGWVPPVGRDGWQQMLHQPQDHPKIAQGK